MLDSKGEFFELFAGETDFFSIDWTKELGNETIVSASSVWALISGTVVNLQDSQADRTTTIKVEAAASVPAESEHLFQNSITTSGGRELVRYLRIKIALPVKASAAVFTEQQYFNLTKAIATGALETEYLGRRTRFRDFGEMLQLKEMMEVYLYGATEAQPRFSYAAFYRG